MTTTRNTRRPDYDTGASDNEDVTVLPPHLFINATNMLSLNQEVFKAQEDHPKQVEELHKGYPLDQVEGH